MVRVRNLIFLSCLLGFGLLGCSDNLQWATVDRMIELEFPEVQQISTDSLALWLEEPDRPVLVDARGPREYAVSHLSLAIHVNLASPDFSVLEGLSRDTAIVTYCSVGYRSSAVAQQLMDAGYTNVANLQGSIFRWANEGRPVYRHGLPVRQVHPYDRLWGQLLDEELHTTRPRAVN